MKTIKPSDLDAGSMMNDPEYAAAYDALEEELALIDTLLRALDLKARSARFSEKVPEFIMDEVLARVQPLFE